MIKPAVSNGGFFLVGGYDNTVSPEAKAIPIRLLERQTARLRRCNSAAGMFKTKATNVLGYKLALVPKDRIANSVVRPLSGQRVTTAKAKKRA